MKTILHVMDVKAPRRAVFDAVTSAEGLSGWWTQGGVTAPREVGGVVRFTFLEGFNPEMEITRLDEPAAVEWRCVGGHEPWADNTFRFELVDHAGGTRLRFRQEYAQELDDDAYGTYNFNWGYYLESLRLLCETGSGKPFAP